MRLPAVTVNHNTPLFALGSLHFPRYSFHFPVSRSGFVTSCWIITQGILHPPSFAKLTIKFSSLLSCSPIVSASPKGSRIVDNCMSFCGLSSSNLLTQASASSQASVARQAAHVRGQPTGAAAHFPSLPQCAMCSFSNKCIRPAGIFRVS